MLRIGQTDTRSEKRDPNEKKKIIHTQIHRCTVMVAGLDCEQVGFDVIIGELPGKTITY